MAIVLLVAGAAAQPPPPASRPAVVPAASDTPPSGNAEAEARAHFKKGTEHFDKAEYREAYDEFRKSLARMKTRAVMAAAASTLKQLGRYDEALDLYEQVRREFPNLPASLEAKVAPAIAELQALVGTLVIAGDAPPGATLFVDDRLRGKLPLAPLRVAVGSHDIRVEKEGFEPIRVTADVKPGQQTVAQLRARSRMGRLSIREKHNWVLQVEIDGKNAGVTPWEGLLQPGDHRVRLHGFVGLDTLAECAAPQPASGDKPAAARDGAKVGSPVATASVRTYEVTPLELSAVELDASLRIESTPSGAALRIDSSHVGLTPWEGRLDIGEHAIEVSARGFLSSRQPVRLERRKQRQLTVVLEPDGAALRRRLRRVRHDTAAITYGAGAVGLGVFAVAGIMASNEIAEIKSRCGGTQCSGSEQQNLNTARTLASASTAGLVVGVIGIAAGTVLLIVPLETPLDPSKRRREAGGSLQSAVRVVWKAGVGLGSFEIEGRF